jgi:secreted PhoX family phosphatase
MGIAHQVAIRARIGAGQVTGLITTPDQQSMFVNLQHPGVFATSTWPQGDALVTPRSATLTITKDDGGVIGT